MPTFPTRDGTIHYLESGSGPTLLLVHGWPVSSIFWLDTIERFSADYRVLAVDLPGFGKSPLPRGGDCSIRAQAERLAAFVREVTRPPILLVGHSMGGTISSRLAVTAPELFEALVLVTAPVEGEEALSPLCQLGRFAPVRLLVGWLLRSAFVRWLAAPYFTYARLADPAILDVAGRAETEAARTALRSITADCSRNDLATISIPTLVIGADRDRIVHPVQPLIAKAWIPGARLEVFRDCGHCPSLEYPDRFERVVRDFLREASLPTSRAQERAA